MYNTYKRDASQVRTAAMKASLVWRGSDTCSTGGHTMPSRDKGEEMDTREREREREREIGHTHG